MAISVPWPEPHRVSSGVKREPGTLEDLERCPALYFPNLQNVIKEDTELFFVKGRLYRINSVDEVLRARFEAAAVNEEFEP